MSLLGDFKHKFRGIQLDVFLNDFLPIASFKILVINVIYIAIVVCNLWESIDNEGQWKAIYWLLSKRELPGITE